MIAVEIKEILDLHLKWLRNQEGGKCANLSGADLRDVDLSDAVKVPIYCKWSHGITGRMINIGCEKRTIEQWDVFFASDEIIKTERNTKEFKQIQAVYNAYKAYLLTFKSE